VAVAAVAAVVGCTADRSERADRAPAPAEPVPQAVEQRVAIEPALLADVVRNPGGLATMAGGSLLVPSYPGSALVVFDLAAVAVDCVEAARLTATHVGGEPLSIEAWVSLETDLAALPDGADLGGQVIARHSPSVRAEPDGGRYEWDVTDLLGWSAAHQSTEVFVLALKPEYVGVPLSASVELGASESGAGAVLSVDQSSGCDAG
jgi:hypothetical protein